MVRYEFIDYLLLIGMIDDDDDDECDIGGQDDEERSPNYDMLLENKQS